MYQNNSENEAKKLSFVIPCYGSEQTIEIVVNEILDVLNVRNQTDYEIILVNDCSPDGVWNVIKAMIKKNNKIKGINLARNFGQHSALMAGYSVCTGDYIVSLDDDGQTPIDELYQLVDKLEEGYDVVYAYYNDIKQKWWRKIGTKIADKMAEILLGMPKGNRGSSFYVMRSFVTKEMLRYPNAYPYLAGLVYRATKNVACIPTTNRLRMEGESGYSFIKLVQLWFNGFSAFSSKPLEVSAYAGITMSFLGFISVIIVIIRKIMGATTIAGWSSLVSIMLIIGGMILSTLGLIGEYIGRIYISINKAPQYVIKDTYNLEREDE